MANIIGPGGSKSSYKCGPGKTIGPGGTGGLGPDMTTKRGYESKRTTGLRDNYKVTGNADNGKAGR
jgi:hypothetical protein